MQKEMLRGLKRIYATPAMIRNAQNNMLDEPIIYDCGWHTYKYDTKYDLMIRCQSRGKILMIAVFLPQNIAKGYKYPNYEIYCNPEGDEYITRVRHATDGKEIKWSSAMICNLDKVDNIRYFDYGLPERFKKAAIWQSYEGKDEIRQFLKVKEIGLKGILEYQRRCKVRNIEKIEKREQKPWDDELALTPPILPGFERWSKHEAADENFIFYKSIHSATGYCSYCEKEVPLIKPQRNKDGRCPCCHRKIKYKLRNKIKSLHTIPRTTTCIQKINDGGGCVIRKYRVFAYYRDNAYDKPSWRYQEEERIFIYDNGEMSFYTYRYYKNKYMRFCKENRTIPIDSWYGNYGKLYRRNLKALTKTILKSSAIMLWKELPCSLERYLFVEKNNPVIEMLAKINLLGLAKEIVQTNYDKNLLNQDATELSKALKIDSARLKRLKNMSPTTITLKWMQYEKMANTIWPDCMISEFGQNRIGINELNFLPQPVKYVKAYNYIKRQQTLSGETFHQTFITYRDYYNLAEQNKWNMTSTQISIPKDLKLAHTNAILFARGESIKEQAKKLEKKWPNCNKILPNLKKYEYSNKEYSIVAPVCIEDMVKEGISLNHCMDHTDFYYDRIQKHEAYPFFLRKTSQKDIPWYTLEVEASGNIRQKRTTGDNQNLDLEAAIPFLYEFMANFKKVMNEEERAQGKKADKKRKEEYKKLREEQKKVWHGKLAGQLLADVLEADFMQAI